MLKKLRKYFISLDVLRLFRLFSFADVNWPWMPVGSGCKLILHPSRTLGRGDAGTLKVHITTTVVRAAYLDSNMHF